MRLIRWIGGALFRPFDRVDAIAGGVVALIAFGVYWYTPAPSVTLLDSGEFVAAAAGLGVPHPTGYPLWTLGAWLFGRLPMGNAAWEVNLFSGFCGALGCGGFAALACSIVRWFWPGGGECRRWGLGLVAGIACGLMTAFSVPVWTQAVIAEVYTLHVLIVCLFLFAIYSWAREPERTGPFIASVGLLALGMSNHQLMLSLVPVPIIALFLLRGSRVLEFGTFLAVVAGVLCALFGLLSGDSPTKSVGIRFLYLTLVMLGALRLWRGPFKQPRVLGWLLVAALTGLLPYLYMPLASATNPPMNWAYTSTVEGFFYSFNRSQYSGSLSSQLRTTVGRMVGQPPSGPDEIAAGDPGDAKHRLTTAADFVGLYWAKILQSLSPLAILGFLAAFPICMRLTPDRRALIMILFLTFFLAGFLQPLMSGVGAELAEWLLQMPYHGYSFALCALISTIGFAGLVSSVPILRRVGPLAGAFLFLSPAWSLWRNHDECSQRGHWFGWRYGHEMLRDLPPGTIVYGGTDPGRFVPTYMILTESTQAERDKIDPAFDRRDLYIITQNATADAFYLRYIRDHYSEDRPAARGWWEKWLGRETQYPARPLVLPQQTDLDDLITDESKRLLAVTPNGVAAAETRNLNSDMAKWIWEKNRDRHTFFVEESFPLEWSYPNAVPMGMGYRIEPEPVKELSRETVDADMQYWERLSRELLTDPHFTHDVDAQRSFSKLRTTGGNIYRYREMWETAEAAYRQALALWPAQYESLQELVDILLEQGRFEEAETAVTAAATIDPLNRGLDRLRSVIRARRLVSAEIEKLQTTLYREPDNRQALTALMEAYRLTGERKRGDAIVEGIIREKSDDSKLVRETLNYFLLQERWADGLKAAIELAKKRPGDAEIQYAVSKFQLVAGNMDAFYSAATEAIAKGGLEMRERYAEEPDFERVRHEDRFGRLLRPDEAPVPSETEVSLPPVSSDESDLSD